MEDLKNGSARPPNNMRAVALDAESNRLAAEMRLRLRPRPPKLREACVEDYDQIAALETRNGLAARPRDDWMSLWRGNPIRQQEKRRWPIGWVLENGTGQIVGSMGNIPLAYEFQGQEIRAVTACAWAVDPLYRNHSLVILDRLLRQEGVDLFVFTTVGPNAEPVFQAFQFSRVPAGTWDKSAFWITNYRGFSQSALNRRAFPWAAITSYPVSAALFCLDSFNLDRIRAHESMQEIEQCAGFDSRFEDFWQELRRQNHSVLLAVRSQETLTWHFRTAVLQQRAWILAISRGSRLTAYAVLERQDNAALGLRRMRLVDYQALQGSEGALRSMLSWTLRKCREEGIHLLEVIGCWLDRPNATPMRARYRRALPSWAFYYKAANKELDQALKDPNIWSPSSYDGDASL